MSCYEWEAGEIKLPAADAVTVRATVKSAVAAHKARLYDLAQTFWKALPYSYRRNGPDNKYGSAVNAYIDGNVTDSWRTADPKLPPWPSIDDGARNGIGEDLAHLLSYFPGGPRRILKGDVDRHVGTPSGTKFEIRCGEGHLTVDGRNVTWTVGENNHAREYGREHPVARAFFGALDRVQWTRGTGGTIVGNDEYSRESMHEGGGGNYVISRYGPTEKGRRP